MNAPKTFHYSLWRHGGWYVQNVHYASGAIGCVSRNYEDRKWRIACDPRPFEERPTFKTRDEAAAAEWELARQDREAHPYKVEINLVTDEPGEYRPMAGGHSATLEIAQAFLAKDRVRWGPASKFRITGPQGVVQ